jgi:hypothetical protein
MGNSAFLDLKHMQSAIHGRRKGSGYESILSGGKKEKHRVVAKSHKKPDMEM